jgi:hypothetical protein
MSKGQQKSLMFQQNFPLSAPIGQFGTAAGQPQYPPNAGTRPGHPDDADTEATSNDKQTTFV